MRRLVVAASAAVLALALVLYLGTQPALAEVNYVVLDLNPAGSVFSWAGGVSGGVVVGTVNKNLNQRRAFLWGASVVDLHPAGFSWSDATSIWGEVQVGQGAQTPSGSTHALLWRGTAASVVDLNGGFTASFASGVSGDVQVGTGDGHAVLWRGTAASVVDLHPAGLISSNAQGVSGDVQVGQGGGHALLWRGTAASVVDLHPAGFISSVAQGVSGDVQVGRGNTPGPGGVVHALLWRGTAASVVDLHPAGFISSNAYGVSGDVQVGYGEPVFPTGGNTDRALLWRGTAGSVVNLHELLPSASSFVGSQAHSVDEGGNVAGVGYLTTGEQHPLLWWATGLLNVSALTIGPQGLPGPCVTLDAAKTLNVEGTLVIAPDSLLRLEGGAVIAGVFQVQEGGTVSGRGVVSGPVHGDALSRISAEGGDLVLGDAGRYDGFSHEGTLSVGANTATLRTKGFASLGLLTELAGGTLNSQSGFALGPNSNLVGRGSVGGRLAATFGSTIEATGSLAVGDASAYDGFFSDGSLVVGANTVTIFDRNEAVLGSLTTLGSGTGRGTLAAGTALPGDAYAHLLLEQGKNMTGRGFINGNYKNQGHVIGDGPAAAERIVFNAPWTVTGKGTFTNTLVMGTFAPGESPAITTGTNQGFGGTVQIELGGTVPGFGNDNHDQIRDAGTILLFGSPTLEVLPWNSFVPNVGDQFVIMTWEQGLDGLFGPVVTNPWFTDHGISFDLEYGNVAGAGSLTLHATPEPATLSLLALGGLVALVRRRRRK